MVRLQRSMAGKDPAAADVVVVVSVVDVKRPPRMRMMMPPAWGPESLRKGRQ